MIQRGLRILTLRIWFIDRNTTLTHPDADTSKNATIEAGDLELTHSNSKRRFLHSRHHSHKSITKGRLDPAEYESVQNADATKEVNGRATNGHVANGAANERGESSEEETLRIERERDEQGYSEGERKKGILRKLHLHKV